MSTDSKALGVIPARGGSKRLPNKHTLQLAGKPLISWTIEVGLSCSFLDRVIVTTEDENIARVAADYGAEVPFLRPAELSGDDVPNVEAVLHAVRWLAKNQDYNPNYVAVLQPTSPLRAVEDITVPLQLAQQDDLDAVVSVCPVRQQPSKMRRLNEDGRVVPYLPSDKDLPWTWNSLPIYVTNGALYLVKTEILLEKQVYEPEGTYAYVMPPERSLDIDLRWDLHVADLVLRDRVTTDGVREDTSLRSSG